MVRLHLLNLVFSPPPPPHFFLHASSTTANEQDVGGYSLPLCHYLTSNYDPSMCVQTYGQHSKMYTSEFEADISAKQGSFLLL